MNTGTTAAEQLFFEGNRHLAAGEAAPAEACFREALGLLPDFPEAHANLGYLLDQGGRKTEAEAHYRQSIAANPAVGQTHLNLGALLLQQKRFVTAESAFRRALELIPESPAAWNSLGVLHACCKQETAAETCYRKALELDADYALASFNFSYLLLRQGRFEEGWRCLEARNWYAPLAALLDCPRWHGESLQGQSLLIGIEAGHGDMIQFCRYAPLLKAQGAKRIGVICHPGLKTLFASLDGVDSVMALDEPFNTAHWDFWTPPLSIPFHLNTRLETIPARLPYLAPERKKAETWSKRLAGVIGQSSDLRVGLVWKGNPRFENDADRSLPDLRTLAALGGLAGVRFFSLQKGVGEVEAAHPPAGLAIVDLAPQISDFSDTAAIVAHLDLVISVDTAVAHLAGALGKDCWILLPDYKTDWRWLNGRRDSPWYPGVVRLFRQEQAGDWNSVIDEVFAQLQARIAGRSAHCSAPR